MLRFFLEANMFRCKSCGAINRVPDSKRESGAEARCGRCKAVLDLSGAPQDVSEAALAQTISSSPVPVLVDFWAPWCQPCRVASPIVDQVARRRAGRVITLKLNTEEQPAPATRHGIRGIPTFILFKDGSEVARQSGVIPPAQFEQWLDSIPQGASAAASWHP
jgi:thioredoxin 2